MQLTPEQIFNLYAQNGLDKKLNAEQFLLTLYDARYPQLEKIEKLIIGYITKLATQTAIESVEPVTKERVDPVTREVTESQIEIHTAHGHNVKF